MSPWPVWVDSKNVPVMCGIWCHMSNGAAYWPVRRAPKWSRNIEVTRVLLDSFASVSVLRLVALPYFSSTDTMRDDNVAATAYQPLSCRLKRIPATFGLFVSSVWRTKFSIAFSHVLILASAIHVRSIYKPEAATKNYVLSVERLSKSTNVYSYPSDVVLRLLCLFFHRPFLIR